MFATSSITATTDNLQQMLNAVPSPLFLIDREHRLIMANDAFCEMVGRPREEIISRVDYPLPDEQKAEFFRVDDEVFSTGLPHENEERFTAANGDMRIILTRKRLIYLTTKEGEQPFILASTTDVTRFREAEKRAQHLAAHDPLTGLANRKRLEDCLASITQVTTKPETPAALILIDLDGFKAVNDQYGHIAGDHALQIVAKRLAALVRSDDTVARVGGDEFCVVQPSGEQPAGAFALAERIVSSLAQPVTIENHQAYTGASIGIAIFPHDGKTPEALMRRADEALYEVKRSGRSGYRRFEVNPDTPGPGDSDK